MLTVGIDGYGYGYNVDVLMPQTGRPRRSLSLLRVLRANAAPA